MICSGLNSQCVWMCVYVGILVYHAMSHLHCTRKSNYKMTWLFNDFQVEFLSVKFCRHIWHMGLHINYYKLICAAKQEKLGQLHITGILGNSQTLVQERIMLRYKVWRYCPWSKTAYTHSSQWGPVDLVYG